MIHLISYGDDKFKNTKIRLYNEAIKSNWFNTIKIYSPNCLSIDFKKKYNDNILKYNRGGGYWIWKYDIITQRLNEIEDNDILIYLDAGCTINLNGKSRFYEYIDILNEKKENCIISFITECIEHKYTIKEIFKYFNVSDDKNITETGQIVGGILIMKKNKNLIKLLNLYNKVLLDNPLLFTDFYNIKQEKNFIDNRHDQSIFSVIRKMNNPLLIKDETYFVPFGTDNSLKYPFWATRIRN